MLFVLALIIGAIRIGTDHWCYLLNLWFDAWFQNNKHVITLIMMFALI